VALVQWCRWFAYLSHWLYLCTHRLHAAAALPQPAALLPSRPSFPAVLIWFHVFATGMTRRHVTAAVFKLGRDFTTLSNQTLLNKDRQCCECWRRRARSRAVGAVGDTTDEDRWVDLLCCSLRRAVGRTIHWLHSVRVLIATTTDAGRHRPSATCPTMPAVRSVGVVYYAVATMRLLLATSYVFLVTFSVL